MFEILKKELIVNSKIDSFMDNLLDNNYSNKWADVFLYDSLPFDMEIHRVKRGKIYKSVPKNKEYKTNSLFDSGNKIIAGFSYIPNWEDPSSYIFIRNKDFFRFIYRFDINRLLTTVFLQEYKDNCLSNVYSLNKNGNFSFASIKIDGNLFIKLHTGLDINNIESKSSSNIIVNYKTPDSIEIVREDSGKQPHTVYSGINPYIENQFMNPLIME